MTETFSVSQSKVQQWRRCKRIYHNANVLHLKPRVKARPLKFGGIVHAMLEARAAGQDPYEKLSAIAYKDQRLFKEEEATYGRLVDDIAFIFRAYEKYWSKQPFVFAKDKKKRTLLEYQFKIELTPTITAKGKIDGVVEHDGRFLLENKTHDKFPNDDHRWRNVQSAFYIRILDMLGVKGVKGTVWNYIRSKSPSRPKVLKSGGLSSVDCDSLPEVVEATIKENGLDREAYQALLQQQQDNLQTWFQRVWTAVDERVVKTIFLEFIRTAREMKEYYDDNDTPPPRTIDLHCSWCPYEKICRAELQDDEDAVDWVLKHDYVTDDSEYGEV